jgi:hypothetical protein
MKNLFGQLFRGKILILVKNKSFLKFLIIVEWRRTSVNGGEHSRTSAKARERLFAVRFLKLRMARIV